MFTTDRLILREWRATDTPNFLRIWNDKRCLKTLNPHYLVPVDTDKAKEITGAIFRASGAILALAIALKPFNRAAASDETAGPSSRTLQDVIGHEEEIFLGWITVHSTNPKNRDGQVGLTILPEYWNKGYGTEALRFVVDYAFQDMNLHRLSLEVFEGNDGAKRVYDKIGFKVEGVKRKANWVEGRWRDMTIMAIIEDEYWAVHSSEA